MFNNLDRLSAVRLAADSNCTVRAYNRPENVLIHTS